MLAGCLYPLALWAGVVVVVVVVVVVARLLRLGIKACWVWDGGLVELRGLGVRLRSLVSGGLLEVAFRERVELLDNLALGCARRRKRAGLHRPIPVSTMTHGCQLGWWYTAVAAAAVEAVVVAAVVAAVVAVVVVAVAVASAVVEVVIVVEGVDVGVGAEAEAGAGAEAGVVVGLTAPPHRPPQVASCVPRVRVRLFPPAARDVGEFLVDTDHQPRRSHL